MMNLNVSLRAYISLALSQKYGMPSENIVMSAVVFENKILLCNIYMGV